MMITILKNYSVDVALNGVITGFGMPMENHSCTTYFSSLHNKFYFTNELHELVLDAEQ